MMCRLLVVWSICLVWGIDAFSPVTTRSFVDSSRSYHAPLRSSSEDDVAPHVSEPPAPVVEATPAVETSIGTEDLAAKKQILFQIAASTDRGQHATTNQREEVVKVLETLEKSSPVSSPTLNSSAICGRWELAYSSSQLFRSSPFFMAGRATCKTKEQADQYDWFCDMHRAALAISNIGIVRQIISEGRMVSEFEVKVGSIPFLTDFVPFLSYSGGLPFTIDGAIVSSADITPTEDGSGWEIFMDKVEIRGSNIPLLRRILDEGTSSLKTRDLSKFLESNVPQYETPKPVFSVTYLDETMRICRDQDGKVFVYVKTSEKPVETDYKSVTPDLGILKLLEGFNDGVAKYYI